MSLLGDDELGGKLDTEVVLPPQVSATGSLRSIISPRPNAAGVGEETSRLFRKNGNAKSAGTSFRETAELSQLPENNRRRRVLPKTRAFGPTGIQLLERARGTSAELFVRGARAEGSGPCIGD